VAEDAFDPQERYDIFMNNYTERTWTLVTISEEVSKLHVWSRVLMVHSSPWNGRMRYGPSSAWERPHDGGSASSDPA
jgi:hypothetical protein